MFAEFNSTQVPREKRKTTTGLSLATILANQVPTLKDNRKNVVIPGTRDGQRKAHRFSYVANLRCVSQLRR